MHFLRILLHHVPGATSFEAMRTYQHVVHPTFKAAAIARGLFEDDTEWAQCLEDAATIRTGGALRELFAHILIFGPPNEPWQLWTRFRHELLDDLLHAQAQVCLL